MSNYRQPFSSLFRGARLACPQSGGLALILGALCAGRGSAQEQFLELTPGAIGTAASTRGVAMGDIDGDGDLDLIKANSGSNQLFVNDGTGVFTDVTALQLPPGCVDARNVVVGDVDGDGDLDIVLTAGTSKVFLNDGSGVFGPGAVLGTFGVEAALGDVDGDGDLDLVQACYGFGLGAQNRLWLNNGGGAFTDATALLPQPAFAADSTCVALGDLNGDGHVDIVFGGWPSDRTQLNDGTGAFLPVNSILSASEDLVLGDIDGDGDLDIASAGLANLYGTGSNALLINDGQASFTGIYGGFGWDITKAAALEDVDGDGDLDLLFTPVVGGQVGLHLNDGAGQFLDVTATRVAMSAGNSLAIGDIDSDGDLDVALGDGGSSHVLVNVQRQLHTPASPHLGQPFVLDVFMRYGSPSLVDVALPYLATIPAQIHVPGLGLLGLDPAVAVPLTPVIVSASGLVSVTVPIPANVGLLGTPVYGQALLVAWPFPVQLSNTTADAIAL